MIHERSEKIADVKSVLRITSSDNVSCALYIISFVIHIHLLCRRCTKPPAKDVLQFVCKSEVAIDVYLSFILTTPCPCTAGERGYSR